MAFLNSLRNREIFDHRSNGQFKKVVQTKHCDVSQNADFLMERFSCYQIDEHVIQQHATEVEVPPFVCKFCSVPSQQHVMAMADENGDIRIYNTNQSGHRGLIKEWGGHSNAIFDFAWMDGEPRLVTASGDQTAILWDVPTCQLLHLFNGHSGSLKAIDFRPKDKFVFASGSRDGSIKIWDTRCHGRGHNSHCVNTISNAHLIKSTINKQKRKLKVQQLQDSHQSVTAITFQDEHTLISAGAADGTLKVWDLRKNYENKRQKPIPKFAFPYAGKSLRKHGFSCLMLDSTSTRLFASCTDNTIYQYNCVNYSKVPVSTYFGHLCSTFYVKIVLSPDDRYLMSGSSDNHAYIYKVDEVDSRPAFRLKGHEGEVTCGAWCPTDFTKFVTCSDDNTLRVWRLRDEAVLDEHQFLVGAVDKIDSHTFTGVKSIQDQHGSEMNISPEANEPDKCIFLHNKNKKSKRLNSLFQWCTEKPPSPTSPNENSPYQNNEINPNTSQAINCQLKRKYEEYLSSPLKDRSLEFINQLNKTPEKGQSPKKAKNNLIAKSPKRLNFEKSPEKDSNMQNISGFHILSANNKNLILHTPTSQLPNLAEDIEVISQIQNEQSPNRIKLVTWLDELSLQKQVKRMPKTGRISQENSPKSVNSMQQKSKVGKEHKSPVSPKNSGSSDKRKSILCYFSPGKSSL